MDRPPLLQPGAKGTESQVCPRHTCQSSLLPTVLSPVKRCQLFLLDCQGLHTCSLWGRQRCRLHCLGVGADRHRTDSNESPARQEEGRLFSHFLTMISNACGWRCEYSVCVPRLRSYDTGALEPGVWVHSGCFHGCRRRPGASHL